MKAALYLVLTLFCTSVSAENLSDLFYKAHVAYKKHRYDECAKQYVEIIQKGSKDPDAIYNAAGCFALGGKFDSAFEYLSKMCAGDFVDIQGFIREPDFLPLHKETRWQAALDQCRQAEKNHISRGNVRLYQLYIVMLRFETHWVPENTEEVLKFISDKRLESAEDYYHAAAILTGSIDPQQLSLAHSLAQKAVALKPNYIQAKGLAAIAYDRFLWSSKKPQVYGTQLYKNEKGEWTAEPFDPNGVSDDERAASNVLSLAGIKERLRIHNEEGIE